MAKNAVYSPIVPYQFHSNVELKKLSMFFKKIYFEKPATPQLKPYESLDKNLADDDGIKLLYNELKVFEYLQENGIVEEYNRVPLFNNTRISNEEADYINSYMSKLKKLTSSAEAKDFFENNFEENLLTTLTIEDIHTRVDALELSHSHDDEFYPILKSNKSFEENGKKSQVIHFVLNNIPAPVEDTPWETIIDFRKDENVNNKYLKLISWINKMAISDLSVSDIKEEYESLYSDYIRAVKLHDMKYTNTILQIIVPVSAGLLTGEPFLGIKLASDYLNMKLKSVALLEEEGKLTGNEIAYIFKINQRFTKG